MKKNILLPLTFLIITCTFIAHAQESNLTTYYTSPFGSYDRLRLVPRAAIDGTILGEPCDSPGLMYTEETDGTIRFCLDDDGDGNGVWGHISGVWMTEDVSPVAGNDESYIIPISTSLEDPLDLATILNVGIGRTDPFPQAQTDYHRLHIHNSGMDFVNFSDPNALGCGAAGCITVYEKNHLLISNDSDAGINIVGTNDSTGLASLHFVEVDSALGEFQNQWLFQSVTEQRDSQLSINYYPRGGVGWTGGSHNWGKMLFTKDRRVGIGPFSEVPPPIIGYNPVLSELHIQGDDGEAALRIEEMLADPNIVFDFRAIDGAPDRFSLTGGFAGDEDTERLTLNTSGHLGIAENNPQARLHISGDATLKLNNQNGIILNDTGDDAFHIKPRLDNYLEFGTKINSGTSFDPAAWNTGLRFFYDPAGASTKERFKAGFGWIFEGVGMGRTEPEATLNIMGDGGIHIRESSCSGSCNPRLTFDNIRSADFQIEVDNNKLVLSTNYVADGSHPTLHSGPNFDTPLLSVLWDWQVGIGTSTPDAGNAFQVGESGTACVVTDTGSWVPASSRKYKTDIHPLDEEIALKAFKQMEPVTFKWKKDLSLESVGFIAEDLPDLVAAKDRKTFTILDITALLTNVVQQQENELEKQKELLDQNKKEIDTLEKQLKKMDVL